MTEKALTTSFDKKNLKIARIPKFEKVYFLLLFFYLFFIFLKIISWKGLIETISSRIINK